MIETENFLIIDDCYNANPISTKASLDVLATADTRKVAILGDMFELGEYAIELHKKVGQEVAQRGIDILICAGDNSKYIIEMAYAEIIVLPGWV